MNALTLLLALGSLAASLCGSGWLCLGLACCTILSWQDDAAIEAGVDEIEAYLAELDRERERAA